MRNSFFDRNSKNLRITSLNNLDNQFRSATIVSILNESASVLYVYLSPTTIEPKTVPMMRWKPRIDIKFTGLKMYIALCYSCESNIEIIL